ncbi:MAG TPA: TIGR00282 family metallophosphoesterase [Phycisphaerae bacterium]|nr:TIGR00282 family metallophosphoesterase [Phycisphaerae bacterium]
MPIKILCLGDIVGKPGRLVVAELLPKVIQERGVDFVVANAENAAGGSGLSPPIFEKILRTGVDVCTMGDHTFRKREVLSILESSERLIRPANFPVTATGGAVGKGMTIITSRGGVRIAVLNVMGRLHMNPQMDDPFRAVDALLANVPPEVKIRILDFHAEVSSEKMAMGWYVAGRVSICYGTHTHTPTADARILAGEGVAGGTAFVSDLGMCGPYDSILGRRKDRVLKFMTTGLPHFFEVATADPRMCGILATVDEVGGNALSIERLDLKGTEQAGAYDADDGKGQATGSF